MGLIVPRCGGDWSVALFLTLAVPELSPLATTGPSDIGFSAGRKLSILFWERKRSWPQRMHLGTQNPTSSTILLLLHLFPIFTYLVVPTTHSFFSFLRCCYSSSFIIYSTTFYSVASHSLTPNCPHLSSYSLSFVSHLLNQNLYCASSRQQPPTKYIHCLRITEHIHRRLLRASISTRDPCIRFFVNSKNLFISNILAPALHENLNT